MNGGDKMRVVKLNLALVSQIVPLRFVFHQDINSTPKCDDWLNMVDTFSPAKKTKKQMNLSQYLPFGYNTTNLKHSLGK